MQSNKIYWAKTTDEAVIPSKRSEDAGYDLYACVNDDEVIVIRQHETVKIRTGIACAFSDDYVLIIKERSSVGIKGLAVRCGVIDSGYRGEIIVGLTNTTRHPMYLSKNVQVNRTYDLSKAIAQAVILPIPKMESEEVKYEDLIKIESMRGTGNMGSSGK